MDETNGFISKVTELVVQGVDLKNFYQAILEDPVGLIRYAQLAGATKELIKKHAPFLCSEWRFWDNIDKFFNGGFLNDEDRHTLIAKLSNESNPQDTCKKVIDLITKINTTKKFIYISNATKALANDLLERGLYFRICNVVMNTLDEDLQFLSDHIDEDSVFYSVEVNGLLATGLMYHRTTDRTGQPIYSFNPLAKAVTEYAMRTFETQSTANIDVNESPKLDFLTQNNLATDKEFKAMLDETFGHE